METRLAAAWDASGSASAVNANSGTDRVAPVATSAAVEERPDGFHESVAPEAGPAEPGEPKPPLPSDATVGDDEAPIWPDESAESAFLAGARERGEPATPAAVLAKDEPEEPVKTLPALNELVNRIPADVRETLDELFRARFVAVKRVPKKALKE